MLSAMVLGVCHPQKLDWLPKTLESIDRSGSIFYKKVLAIDEFKGMTFPNSLSGQISSSGWEVMVDNHMSRHKSMLHALDAMQDAEYVFYHEDDVLVDMPSLETIVTSLEHVDNGRQCGMASLTLGGTKGWFSFSSGVGDLANIRNNIITETKEEISFKREELNRDIHFFEFPGLFVRTDLLRKCLDYAAQNCISMQIEQALTKAWFELKLDMSFFKCSIARSSLPDQIMLDDKQIFKNCRFLTNLDPKQGSSGYFGSHHI